MSIESIKSKFEFHMDFPVKGVNFFDIGSIIRDGEVFREFIDILVERINKEFVFDKIVVLESRGFVFGSPVAYALKKDLVMIRKKGKLPGETIQSDSTKEYGSDILEIQKSSIDKGEKVLIIDDVLATGGTAKTAAKLIEDLGGTVAGMCFVSQIPDLVDKKLVEKYKCVSIFEF